MIKKFTILILIATFSLNLFAHNKLSKSHWSGTVFVDQNTVIENNEVLTIDPGTVVKFAHDVSLTARYGGQIICDAHFGPTIIFTSIDDNTVGDTISGSDGNPEPGDWGSIYLSMDNVYWDNVKISYGGKYFSYYSNSALNVVSDTVLLKNCYVEYAGYTGINLSKNGNLTNCYVNNCGVNGVSTNVHAVDSITINNCDFSYNGYGAQIYGYGGVVSINNSIFNNNTYYGIYVSGSNSGFSQCLINNSQFNYNGEKAVVLSKVILHDEFTGNTVQNNGMNAFYISSTCGAVDLYNNGDIPYVFGDGFNVTGVFNIYEGTIVKNEDSKAISETAELNIYGTAQNPVIFTSIADDSFGGDTENNGSLTQPSSQYALSCQGNTNIEYANFYYSIVFINNGGSIKNSKFENCTSGSGSALYGEMIADSCTFTNNNIGISTMYDTSYVNNCTFINNTRGVNNSAGIVVRNSTFSANQYGMYITYGDYNDLGKNSTDSIGNNTFTGNSEYDIYNGNEYIVYAIKNNWDGSTAAEINSKIYDYEDDTTLGKVLFDPWIGGCDIATLAKPSGETEICANITSNVYTVENSDNQITVNWNISPQNAGTIVPSGNSAEITWNLEYVGDVNMWVFASDGDCVGENSDTLIISRVALPEKPFISQSNDTLIASVGTNYQWFKRVGDTITGYLDPINGETDRIFKPTENGNYAVEVFNSAGCSSISDDYVYSVSSIQNIENNKFRIYPNNTSGSFVIDFNSEDKHDVAIINIAGEIVYKTTTYSNKLIVNLDTYSGMYFVKVNSIVKKLIIKK